MAIGEISRIKWPDTVRATIPPLRGRPPFDLHQGLESKDRVWKKALLSRILRGEIDLPGRNTATRIQARDAITDVTHRGYHVARVVQHFFDNPNHGNYADPLLETLFILLTWRSRIEDASSIMEEIRSQFRRPADILKPGARKRLIRIVGRAGFRGKRPDMVITIVRLFLEHFPDGNMKRMHGWTDEKLIEFLTSMPGIARKSALCVLMYSLGRDRFPIDAHIRRVLRRTGLLRELYEENGEKEHRDYQAEAEQFVPTSVRRALHIGLLAVGQEYCRPRRPRCNECPIHYCCRHYRNINVTLAQGRRLTHVELFSGAGGFGNGFDKESYRTILAVDRDGNTTRTYRLNHPSVPEGNVLTLDLESISPRGVGQKMERWADQLKPGKVHVITAGIPCQGFSKAGYRSRPKRKYNVLDDPRNQLFRVIVLWTVELQSRYVVIENVPDMRSAGRGEGNILNSLKATFEKNKYFVDCGTVNASSFGVPQTRRRLILIASHPSATPVTVQELEIYQREEKHLIAAIGDLPPVKAGKGTSYMRINGKMMIGHRARYNNSDDLEIFSAIRPGERYVDFVKRRKDIIQRRRQNSTRAVYSTGSFADKYYKLEADRPSRTIVAHLHRDGNGYIHPYQKRSITPREAARIQGFDDDFVFAGGQGAQFVQIGNAVPPGLARAIARLLAHKLTKAGT